MVKNYKALIFASAALYFCNVNGVIAQPMRGYEIPPPPPNTVPMMTSEPQLSHVNISQSHAAQTPAPVIMFRQTIIPPPREINYAATTEATINEVALPKMPVQMAANAQMPVVAHENPQISPPVPSRSIIPQSIRNFYNDATRAPEQIGDPTRGPIRAIVQDTRTAIIHDAPQALADILPWVDNTRKQEPFESVLARVSDNLERANASDPAWALPAQNEIRDLATRLDRLPAPPQYHAEIYPQQQPVSANSPDSNPRPFHARPIWPGARPVSEQQIRPTTVISSGNEEIGVSAAGQNLAPQFEAEEAPPAAPQRPARRRRR